MIKSTHLAIALMLAAAAGASQCADWSDAYIGYTYGTKFRQPAAMPT